jgi:hypothetical protein
MNYKELKPTNKIKKIINAYWIFSNIETNKNQTILPDGCIDIIFNLGKSTNSIPKKSIVISGMMTKYHNEVFEKNTELFGIRFKTGQLNCLTKYPLSEITNKIR